MPFACHSLECYCKIKLTSHLFSISFYLLLALSVTCVGKVPCLISTMLLGDLLYFNNHMLYFGKSCK